MREELAQLEAAWQDKPLLRRVYRGWYAQIARCLADPPGPTVELGSGIGRLREVIPEVVLTDVEPTPYADRVVDAEALPFADASVANLVLLDVFHHLAHPGRFLDEATRALAQGGRVVMLEPYCSPLSTIAYRRFHHETLRFDGDGLEDDEGLGGSPWEGNIARPTAVFFRSSDELARRWPQLRVVERRTLSLFVYALSGGYSKRARAPGFLYRPLTTLENLLSPLGRVAAFRCLVVLQRR